MTRRLHQDPDRRCRPLEEWPEVDRRLWQAALVPGDLLEEGGSRAMAAPIRAQHRPARPKPPRLVAPRELFDLGVDLMVAAERRNAACDRGTTYRDGLMISLLAARPLRVANLVGLSLDRTLVRRGNEWWIEIPAAETKTREPIELRWPERLIDFLYIYLVSHRQVLAQRHGRWTRPIGEALWVSRDGSHCCTRRD